MSAADSDPVIIEHPMAVRKALWRSQENSIVTGCDDGILRFWDLRSNTVAKEMQLTDKVRRGDPRERRTGSIDGST